MGTEIERFLLAIRAFAERVEGPGGEARDIATMAHTLARIATGGQWFADPHLDLVGACPPHRQGARDITDGSEANLRQWLTDLVNRQRMLESFLITGLVWHIEERLEEFVEDGHHSPRRTRADHAAQAARVVDPWQCTAMAKELNAARRAMGLQDYADVTVEEVPTLVDQLYARYRKRVTPEQMEQQWRVLQAWRDVVVPILRQSTLA
jgi:hypothetical protein